MKNWSATLGLLALLALPLPALAQEDAPELDCDNAQTQVEMTGCASQDFDEADAALNAQYKKTRAAMRQMDADFEADQHGAEEQLLKAQRAWVAFRDAECAYSTQASEGGSIHPMEVSQCLTKLTETRTKQLTAATTCSDGDVNCTSPGDDASDGQ